MVNVEESLFKNSGIFIKFIQRWDVDDDEEMGESEMIRKIGL